MKRLLFFIVVLLFAKVSSAQVAAISGSASVCVSSSYGYADGTPGGTWSSSNTSVATINASSGVLTAVSPGSTNIVYRVGPSTATLDIIVHPLPGPISGPVRVCKGYSIQLTDSGGGTWLSLSPTIASIGSTTGVLTGLATGSADIVYTLPTGCRISEFITVNPNPKIVNGGIAISNISGGNTTHLTDSVLGGTWSSSNALFATVVPTTGWVTGLRTGLVEISYTLPTSCYVYAQVSINQIPDTNVVGDLIAWYPFCSDFFDHTSSGYNLESGALIVSGGIGTGVATVFSATPTPDRYSDRQGAVMFNGDSTELHYNTFIPVVDLTNSITFSCWIYPTALQNSAIMYDGNLGNDPLSSNGFGFVMNDTPSWSVGNPYLPIPGQFVKVLFGGIGEFGATYVSLNQWSNLVLIKSGNSYTFYVNNGPPQLFNVLPTYKPLSAVSGSIFSVGNDSALTRGFIGKIDDIGIWNRRVDAIERDEIQNFNPDVDSFSIGRDTVICTDSMTLVPTPQTIGAIYVWGTVNPFTFVSSVIDTTITDTSMVIDPPPYTFTSSTYWLTITKPFGCYYSDTMRVFKLPIPVHLGRDTNICVGDTLTLRAHGDSTSAVKFLWSTGSISDSIKVYSTGTYAVTVDSEFYYLRFTGTDSSGGRRIYERDSALCVGRDTINIAARVVPLIDLGPANVGSCVGKPYTIHNADSLYDTSFVYTWSVATHDDSLLVTTSGTFWVEVNNNGCIRYDTVNVVIVYDTMRILYPTTMDTSICKGAAIPIRVSNNPLVGLSYQWTPTDYMSVSNIPGPTIQPDTSALYVLRTSYPGCPDVLDSIFIDVQPNPKIYIGANRPVCLFDTLHINSVISPTWYPYYSYTWSPTVSLDDPHASSVVFTAGDTTILVLTVSTPFGCHNADSIELIVHQGAFDSQMAEIFVCPGDSVQLMPLIHDTSILNGVIASHRWKPGMYLSDSNSSTPWVHAITNIVYTEIGISQYGCKDTSNVSIHVHPAAVIFLGDSVTVRPGTPYSIPTQTNCTYFSWTPSLAINDTNSSDPIVNPYVNTRYKVKATTQDGCVVVDSIEIHVTEDTLVKVPNAFTPGTGINGLLKVLTNGAPVMLNYFRIYDRWGVKIFETNNINDGWDGTFGGKPQPLGVYIYQVQALDALGFHYNKTGNVTLLR